MRMSRTGRFVKPQDLKRFCGILHHLHKLAAASMMLLSCSSLQRPKRKRDQTCMSNGRVSQKQNTLCHFVALTFRTRPLHPVWRWRAASVRSLLVESGFLLRFGVWGQQSVSLVLEFLQQLQCFFQRQLHILQLLQQFTLLLWKTAAHW